MAAAQTVEVEGIGTCVLMDGKLIPVVADATPAAPAAVATTKVEIPTAIVNVGTKDDVHRVRVSQRYEYGKVGEKQPFKSHGGFRIHVEGLAADGTTAKDERGVNLTVGQMLAIRKLSDAQVKQFAVNAIA